MNRTLGQLLRSVISKNLKSWEELLPHVEFAYNRAVHSTTNMSPFETVYGFNPLSPIDLLVLPYSAHDSLDGEDRAKKIKEMHKQIKEQIEKRNAKVATRVNQTRKKVTFQPGDWVWIHLRNECFP